jgi:hypothetical protein
VSVRVHKFEQSSDPQESPTDGIVLYQLWGATVSKHVELVVESKSNNSEPAATRFPHDHSFVVVLDKRVTSKSKHIARTAATICVHPSARMDVFLFFGRRLSPRDTSDARRQCRF